MMKTMTLISLRFLYTSGRLFTLISQDRYNGNIRMGTLFLAVVVELGFLSIYVCNGILCFQ